MRDKRPVDELSVEELERVLAIRRREDRQKRLTRMKAAGRVLETPEVRKATPPAPTPEPVPPPDTPDSVAIPAASITLEALDAILERKDAPPRFETQAIQPHVPASPMLVDADEDYSQDIVLPQPEPVSTGRRFINALLLLVEVAAVLGLVFIGVNLYQALGDVQKESAEVQALADAQRRAGIPTPAPTSVIEVFRLEDYLLPGGHVIDDQGNVTFNFEELLAADIPAQFQSTAFTQALAINLVRPARTTETALQIFIPRLNVDATIVQGSDDEALKLGVAQVLNGANPGDAIGNVALAAHNDVFGGLFARIPELEEGDQIQVQTANETYTYYVTGWEIVKPTDVRVLDDRGKPTVTLITCYPPGVNDRRYIIYADRSDSFRGQNS